MEYTECWYKDVCKQECDSDCVRFLAMNSLCKKANLPIKLRFPINVTCNAIDAEAFKFLNDYKRFIVNHVNCGDNLYIFSKQCGNGKTSWASKIIMKYFDEVWHRAGVGKQMALFIHTPKFLIDCKEHFRKDDQEFNTLVEQAKKVPLIVWDDVTFPALTDYERALFLDVLDTRFNNGLSNIFTGNFDKDDLSKVLDRRIYSRIWNNSIHVELKEPDKRGLQK